MNIEAREAATSARQLIIPSGVCVDTEAILFERLDSGDSTSSDLHKGQLACQSCIQQPICNTNRSEIGAMLFGATGRTAFIGGDQAPPPDDVHGNVISPAIKFNLQTIPSEPQLGLTFLRRAVRTGQLHISGHTPKRLTAQVEKFMEDTNDVDPSLYETLHQPPAMSQERALRGIRNVFAALFLQADYEKVAAGVKNKRRYDERRLDVVTSYGIARLFAREMITLDGRGFKRPERQALAYSVSEYEQLTERYLVGKDISTSDFHYFLVHNLLDPEKALRERESRLHILREMYYGKDIPEAALKERARWSIKELDETVEPAKKRGPDNLKISQVRQVIAQADEGIAPSTPQEITAVGISRKFSDDPYFSEPASIARFVHLPLADAIQRCTTLQGEIKATLEARGTDESVPDGYIAKHIIRRGPDSYENIKAAYAVARLSDRFRQRFTEQEAAKRIPHWAIEQVMRLYQDYEQAYEATEGLYACRREGFLTESLSEMDMLQDLNYRSEVSAICHPKSGRYMTFIPALQKLNAGERLALACHYGVSRLLYGIDIEKERVASMLGVDDLDAYFIENTLPKCRDLVTQGSPDSKIPTLLMRLSDDLNELEDGAADVLYIPETLPEDVVTVIGGMRICLGPQELKLSAGGQAEVNTWLRQTIFSRCQPNHMEVAPDVEQALRHGVLEIVGSSTTGYRITFSEAIRQTGDEQEIAALAHVMGIDTFMFGCDMKDILTSRLEIGIGETASRLTRVVSALSDHARQSADIPLRTTQSYFGPMEEDAARWLLSELIRARRNQGQDSIRTSAMNLKKALADGVLTVKGTAEQGYVLQLSDTVIINNSAGKVAAFVDACGAMELLDEESMEKLRSSQAGLLEQQRQAEARARKLELAISVIGHKLTQKVTVNQAPRLHNLLAFHMGRTAEKPTIMSPSEKRLFEEGMLAIGTAYRDFRGAAENRAHNGGPGTNIAAQVIGDITFGHMPQSLATILRELSAEHPKKTLLEWRLNFFEEIIRFGNWLARQNR